MFTGVFEASISSHDLLRQGVLEERTVRVAASADSHNEARLVACQMASLRGFVTECEYIE